MTVPSVNPDEPTESAETPTEDAVADEPAAFENRAARRSRGKRNGQQQPSGTPQRLDGRPVSGPRQWGNRRSG